MSLSHANPYYIALGYLEVTPTADLALYTPTASKAIPATVADTLSQSVMKLENPVPITLPASLKQQEKG
jgi:hypothetical protein